MTVSSVAALAPTQLCDEQPERESSAPAFAREAVQPHSKVNGSLGPLFLGHGCVQSPAAFPWAVLGSLNPPAAAWFIYINRQCRNQHGDRAPRPAEMNYPSSAPVMVHQVLTRMLHRAQTHWLLGRLHSGLLWKYSPHQGAEKQIQLLSAAAKIDLNSCNSRVSLLRHSEGSEELGTGLGCCHRSCAPSWKPRAIGMCPSKLQN